VGGRGRLGGSCGRVRGIEGLVKALGFACFEIPIGVYFASEGRERGKCVDLVLPLNTVFVASRCRC